jgi:hypothetical protein
MPNRIVIGGPHNCGKSTLAASIYRKLQHLSVSAGIHEIDVFSDTIPCILGIKPWEKRQKRRGGNWKDPLIDKRINDFAKDKSNMVIGDLPGIIDGLLEKMVKPATAAIVVGKSCKTFREWLDFFERQSIPVIIKIASYIGEGNNWHFEKAFPDALPVGNMNRRVLCNNEICVVVRRLLVFKK